MTPTVMIQSCCHMPPFVTLSSWFGDTKIPFAMKKEAQGIGISLKEEIGVNVPKFHAASNLTVQTSAVSVFNQVSPVTMAEAQTKDSVLGLVIPYICKGQKTKGLGHFKN